MEHFSINSDSQQLFRSLLNYEPGVDPSRLQEAYQLTIRGHSNTKRASGEPYFEHPINVARLLIEKHMDSDTIIAGLLHDIVEDTATPIDYIRKKFGKSVADLVDGVTKLKLSEQKMIAWLREHPRQDSKPLQLQNFRKLLTSSLHDPRVLIIKLADRLHNMKTLDGIPVKSKRRRIARETLDIYVPIARRLGIEDWKNTMSFYAFREVHPKAHSEITQMIEQRLGDDHTFVDKIAAQLQEKLLSLGGPTSITVHGRIKDVYSIWQKMQEDKLDNIGNIKDILGCRVICENIDQCYFVLGLLHTTYHHKPYTFKDYISVPKPNGYRSLHSGVFTHGLLIEVQIRTQSMQEINAFGPAAHWRYKESSNLDSNPLQSLTEIINESSSNPAEFLDNTRLAIGSEEIQVFTPKGQIINLQHGASVLDFAFAVHSDIGFSCTGAKINGRTVAIPAEIHNGNVVEVITATDTHPTANWLHFAHTPRARTYIRRFLNQKLRQNRQTAGQKLIYSLARKNDIAVENLEEVLAYVAIKTGCGSADQLFALVGERKIDHNVVIQHLRTFLDMNHVIVTTNSQSAKVIPCNFCKPIPGDKILGITHPQLGVIAHLAHCKLYAKHQILPSINAVWNQPRGLLYPVTLSISVKNVVGILATFCTTVAENRVNIQCLNFQKVGKTNNELSQAFTVTVDINHRKKLDKLITHIKNITNVYSVTRI